RCREGYDRTAWRQTCHLLVAGIGKGRKTRPAHMFDITDEPPHQWLYRVCAKEHGLLETAGMQETSRKDVASFRIRTELDLIDRQEVDRSIKRHRLDGAHEI